MKGYDKAIIRWGIGAILAAVLFECALIDLSLRVSSLAPAAILVWFFPCLLIPAICGVQVFHFRRMRSRRQRILTLKYLTIYFPILAVSAGVSAVSWRWMTVWQLATLPLLIFIPFWFSKKMMALQREESTTA